ncbi:MAG: hypothetical protein PVG99_09175 [Desulfobacteraceae bacterium]|jgi:hypothetical protein
MSEGKSRIEILQSEGWIKQFVAGEPRLSEAAEMYSELGFEVHLEPLPKEPECETCVGTEDGTECRICFEGFEDQYKIIFTRPLKFQPGPDDELF